MTTPRAVYPDLAGRRVIVTGAGQGIGQAVAEAFLQAGALVTTISRRPLTWAAPQEGRLESLVCDITDLAALEDWLAALEGRNERVHVLVNNAGVMARASLIDCTPAEFDEMFGVNVRGTLLLTQLVARHMRTRGGGVVINAASYAATLASVAHGVYAASKSALVSLTRSMAAEWAPYGIRVNAFSPGVIPTRMTAPALAARRDRMLESISLRRPGDASEVADAVLFLASDASSYLTGINLDVSGGKLVVQDPGNAWGAP